MGTASPPSTYIHPCHTAHTSPFTLKIVTLARATIQPLSNTHLYLIHAALARATQPVIRRSCFIVIKELPRVGQRLTSCSLLISYVLMLLFSPSQASQTRML